MLLFCLSVLQGADQQAPGEGGSEGVLPAVPWTAGWWILLPVVVDTSSGLLHTMITSTLPLFLFPVLDSSWKHFLQGKNPALILRYYEHFGLHVLIIRELQDGRPPEIKGVFYL